MFLQIFLALFNIPYAHTMEISGSNTIYSETFESSPTKSSAFVNATNINLAYSRDLESPVTKFTSLKVEPILDIKDDNGFGPLKPRLTHIKSSYWNLKFHTYHLQLTNLFTYELQSHRAIHGIHFPPILRYYQPTIIISKNRIVVTLDDDQFNTIAPLGMINLKKHGWDTFEGYQFCVSFLKRFTLYDHIYLQFQKLGPKPFSQKTNHPYWTVIDDYILSELTKSPHHIPTMAQEKDELNEEIIRKIGEFFKWHKIVTDFIEKTPLKLFQEIQIETVFERYLTDEIHVAPNIAKAYSKIMNLKNATAAMLMSPLSLDNQEHVHMVFDEFVKWGLIPDKRMKPKYMEYFTG